MEKISLEENNVNEFNEKEVENKNTKNECLNDEAKDVQESENIANIENNPAVASAGKIEDASEDVFENRELIVENLDKCVYCNLCKSSCPVFYATSKETLTPRAIIEYLLKNTFSRKNIICANCGFCEKECPINVKINFIEINNLLNKEEETEFNEIMIYNVRKYKTPFGPLND